jgi:hypothetical protein
VQPSEAQLKMHEIFRLPQLGRERPVIDGLRNLYVVTGGREREIPLGSGINPMADRLRCGSKPAIVISSSPWKAGSESTPWHDVFDIPNGHVRYFGDAKAGSKKSATKETGNASLLEELPRHRGAVSSHRSHASPLLLFRAVSRNGAVKGFREFCGLGVLERAERVVQWNEDLHSSFVNYVYDIALLDLSQEDDLFDWSWINLRAELGPDAALHVAPLAWQKWVADGERVLPRVRRRVPLPLSSKKNNQLPPPGSRDEKILQQIYGAFSDRKHAFESLASRVVGRVLRSSGTTYIDGWITKASGDHGVDFVSRLDVGNGAANVKLVVLGQAKCTAPRGAPVSAGDLARVVARLRRGWLGAYVTTATYSEPAQAELLSDEYPILLVNGAILAAEVRLLAAEAYGGDIERLLQEMLDGHDDAVANRRPEEILHIDGTYAIDGP